MRVRGGVGGRGLRWDCGEMWSNINALRLPETGFSRSHCIVGEEVTDTLSLHTSWAKQAWKPFPLCLSPRRRGLGRGGAEGNVYLRHLPVRGWVRRGCGGRLVSLHTHTHTHTKPSEPRANLYTARLKWSLIFVPEKSLLYLIFQNNFLREPEHSQLRSKLFFIPRTSAAEHPPRFSARLTISFNLNY